MPSLMDAVVLDDHKHLWAQKRRGMFISDLNSHEASGVHQEWMWFAGRPHLLWQGSSFIKLSGLHKYGLPCKCLQDEALIAGKVESFSVQLPSRVWEILTFKQRKVLLFVPSPAEFSCGRPAQSKPPQGHPLTWQLSPPVCSPRWLTLSSRWPQYSHQAPASLLS